MDGYPGNGIYVVQGEISALITSMKKVHWSARSYLEDENNPLMKSLNELKMILNQIIDLREIELVTFLEPFLDIIHSSETTVQVTALALSSINKFITYGLIGGIPEKELLPVVENIAETVSHANFVTTDYPSDAVILMKIVEVLRTLVMSPLGILLSNDSICEIMLSCFRICFEVRLNELLRQNAEHCLKDIVQMLFRRLPLFTQSSMADGSNYKKMRIRSKAAESNQKKKKSISSDRNSSTNISTQPLKEQSSQITECPTIKTNDEVISKLPRVSVTSKSDNISEADITIQGSLNSASLTNVIDGKSENEDNSEVKVLDSANRNDTEKSLDTSIPVESAVNAIHENSPCNAEVKITHCTENCDISPSDMGTIIESTDEIKIDCANSTVNSEKISATVNPSAPIVHYDQSSLNFHSSNQQIIDGQIKNSQNGEQIALEPHNSVCVQELLRFLSLICNPHDKQNTEVMIHVSLSLLVIALEVGANSISKHPALLTIIKDTLCRNLLSLLQTEKMQIFTMNLHVSFLIFESMRSHLKFQLEFYLTRLSDIIVLDASKISYEKKEMALESLVQLWKIPGFVTELFLNYDCDLYCPNLYEEITKLLSKNVYPVAGIYSTHLLSLDALLTIVESIEKHCHSRISNEKTTIDSSHSLDEAIKGDNSTVSSLSIKDTSNKNEEGTAYNIPTHEQLMALKRKKKLLSTGTEHFNSQPKKGIQFLQEQGLLSTPLEPSEVANFLRENPHLDKKMIGEFISHRNNLQVLESFVKSFDFTDMRIDEALRVYLETFRLPGESPLISLVMQQFADHWHKCNNEPFTKSDAAFVLAYAVIMLNVDQHNQIVRRQHTPMTVDDFKKNLKGVDAGKDFNQDLLNEIYQSIKNEEIVMPAEHTGLVRENYLWKVLLRRGASKDGKYILAYDGLYDHELFSICWGPVVTALGYVFDKATDSSIYYKSIQGFRKCATISAHYGMSNEFDFLTLSLCKFTALLSSFDNADSFVVSFGMNSKARLAARTVFSLVHRYGDILREGWRPIFDCIFQLFRCKLLPKILVEAEDFLELSGKVSIVRDDPSSHKTIESGILSSLYSYITLATDASSPRFTTDEEQECTEIAKTCIIDCHLENLILESKFLRLESLHELLKVLIKACYNSEDKISINNKREEDKAIFFLELLLKVVIQNRDRVNSLWPIVCEHMNVLLLTAANCNQQFLLERCVIGYLRLAIRLMRKEEISSFVLQSLNTLLLLKWSSLSPVCRQIAYGLHELLKTSAANIHTAVDWSVIFTLLEVVGAGAPLKSQLAQSTEFVSSEEANTEVAAEDSGLGDKFSGSDSSINHLVSSNISSPSISSLHLESKDIDNNSPMFYLSEELMPHDPFALVKCCESLAFLVRDVAHITPFNFENCVHCIRTFVEATFYSEEKRNAKRKSSSKMKQSRKVVSKKTKPYSPKKHSNNPYDADESDPEEYPDSYYQIPLQLLDLMHTLHTRTAQIYRWWAEEESSEADMSVLWPRGWCPLLQGISRFCCDPRKPIRMSAITYLQRALLMHDLQTLTADEWSSCFSNVLFPLMEKLLEPLNENDHAGMEETRMRAATLLLKVFLHHLTPLQTLQSFTELWLRILDFMDRYMNIDKHSDLLNEAIQESVKNMLLVMDSANLFTDENKEKHSSFWDVTWERINKFLPNLKDELYRHHSPIHELNEQVAEELPNSQMTPMENINGQSMDSSKNEPETTERQHCISELTKNSIPIFPHMGQLISTPIGPPMITKEFVSDNNFQNENLRETTINEHQNIGTNEPNIQNTPYNTIITTDSYYYPEVCTPTTQLAGGHTEFSSLITTSSDFLPTLPAIRPHSFVPFSTEQVLQYQPTIPSNASVFPVYSGFLQLSNNSSSSIGQQGDASQFFYQNLNEYHNIPSSYPEVASQNFIGSNTGVIDPAISNSPINTKLSEEP